MSSLSRRAMIIGGGALLATAAAAYVGARVFLPAQVNTGTVFSENGVAIRGTDPVAYFTENAPVAGSAEHAVEWSGTTWYFASADHKALFEASPETYAPQFGGYCAWAVAAKGQLFSTQPSNWAIVDDRLYLNFNDRVQEVWNEDRPGFISEGHRRWPDLQGPA